jgi:branched-chain amino acid transport system permease protein
MASRAGYYFVSIREDQDAAESLGIPTTKYKMYSLIPSALFSGLAGAFYMNYMNYIEPSVVFSLPDVSIMIILVVILGGVATLWGPVIGAIIYVILSELFRSSLGLAHLLVFGVIVCFVIMYMPNGIMGEANKIKKLFRRKGAHMGSEIT